MKTQEILVVFSSFSRDDQFFPFPKDQLSFVANTGILHVYYGKHVYFEAALVNKYQLDMEVIARLVVGQIQGAFKKADWPRLRLLIHHQRVTELLRDYLPEIKIAYYSTSGWDLYENCIKPMYKKALAAEPFDYEFRQVLNDRFVSFHFEEFCNQLLDRGNDLSWIEKGEPLPKDMLLLAREYNTVQSAIEIFYAYCDKIRKDPGRHVEFFKAFKNELAAQSSTSL